MDPGSAPDGAVAPSGLPGMTPLLLKQARSPSAARNDDQARTTKRALALSRHDLPECCPSVCPSFKSEGAGKTGCWSHPRSACSKKARGRTTGDGRNNRSSLRDGLTNYTRSPWGPAFLPPSPTQRASVAADLTSAPGGQDHTTSSSVSMSFVGMIRSRCDPTRPPHPRLAYRDDRAYAPLVEAGWSHDPQFP